MAFPSRPTALSNAPGSLWWRVATNPVQVCWTQGKSFVRRVQTVLQRTDPSILADGIWGANTGNALARVAENLSLTAPGAESAALDSLAAVIRGETASRRISKEAFRFAVWVAYLMDTGNLRSSVMVQSDTILPAFGSAPPDDAGLVRSYYSADCGVESQLAAATPEAVPVPMPLPTPGTPPAPPAPRPQVASSNVLPVLAGVLGVGLFGYAVLKANAPSGSSRGATGRAPARSTPRARRRARA